MTRSVRVLGTLAAAAAAAFGDPARPEPAHSSGALATAIPSLMEPSGDEVLQLAPLIVEEKMSRSAARHGAEAFGPQEPGGNLDLPRTEDDVLPFTIYDRERISRSGAVNLEEFLRRELLDSTAASGPNPAKAGPGAGLMSSGTNLQLRGYAADETVVLVNGRRMPETVIGGANSQPLSPDVNLIPLSLVERIEVLPVSAAALYSGNPVGGVVNVVLRSNVDVSEVTTNYVNTTGGYDAAQSTLSLLHGQTLFGGALRVRLNATLTQTTPATEAELGHIRARRRTQSAGDIPLYGATPNVRTRDGGPLLGAAGPSFASVAPGSDGTEGLAGFASRAGVWNTDLFSAPGGLAYSPGSQQFPYGQRQQTQSLFASVVYDAAPWLQLGVDAMVSRTRTNRGFDVFPAELNLAADSPMNPFGRPVVVSLAEVAPDLGPDFAEARRAFASAVLGAVISLPADWRASIDTQLSRSTTDMRGLAGVDFGRWQSLVDRGSYNPLRDTQVFAPPPEFAQEVLIYAGAPGQFVRVGDYRTVETAVRVTNRQFRLPTGTAALNLGGDFRATELSSYHDEQRYGSGELAAAPVHWKGRTLQRLSTFGELQAPLVPASWLPRWLTGVEADVAGRYTLADTSQESNLAPTAGLKLGFAGGLALRASLATSNRLPTPFLSQKVSRPTLRVNSASGISYIPVFDPRRRESYGVRSGEALNPNLQPESAMTRSLGLIFERGRMQRIRAAVDFVDTQKSGELMYLDAQNVLNLEAELPERVQRAPLTPGDPLPGRATTVLTGNFNVAWRHSQNLTTSVDYAWLDCAGGTFDLYGRWVDFMRYDRQLLPDSAAVDELREPDGTTPGLLRHRANFGAGWSNRRYGFRVDGHYFDSKTLPVSEWPSQGTHDLDPYVQIDAALQKDLTAWLPWKSSRTLVQAQLRVDNVLRARPVVYANDPSGAGVQAYGDWRGQTYSLSVRVVF